MSYSVFPSGAVIPAATIRKAGGNPVFAMFHIIVQNHLARIARLPVVTDRLRAVLNQSEVGARALGYFLTENPPFNYLDLSRNGRGVSCIPMGKLPIITEEGKWSRGGRQDIKFSSFLDRLGVCWGHDELNQLVAFGRAHREGWRYSILSGENAINDVYDGVVALNGESGNTSCMDHEPVGEFLHAAGAQVVLFSTRDHYYAGRALYWPSVHWGYLDRTYTAAGIDLDTAMLASWLRKMIGCVGASRQGMKVNSYVDHYGGVHDITEFPSMRKGPECFDFVPYMDTFYAMDAETLEFRTSDHAVKGECHFFNETCGGYEKADRGILCKDGEYYPEEETVYVDGEHYHREDDRLTHCEGCDELHNHEETNMYSVDVPYPTNRTVYLCDNHVSQI